MAPRGERRGPSIIGLATAGVAIASAVGFVREKMRNMDLQDVLEATEYEVRFLRERTQELAQENERLKKRVEELEAEKTVAGEARPSPRSGETPTQG